MTQPDKGWKAHEDSYSNYFVLRSDGTAIARILIDHTGTKGAKGHAYKMAAAEELLAACKEAIAVWNGQENPFEYPWIGDTLRTAIAKAEPQ